MVETCSITSHAWVVGLTSRTTTRPCIRLSWRAFGGSSNSCTTKVLCTVALRYACTYYWSFMYIVYWCRCQIFAILGRLYSLPSPVRSYKSIQTQHTACLNARLNRYPNFYRISRFDIRINEKFDINSTRYTCFVLTTAICHLLLSLQYWRVQYTSVSHCSLIIEAPCLRYGVLSTIVVLEKCKFRSLKVLEKSLNFVFWVWYQPCELVSAKLTLLTCSMCIKVGLRYA